MLAATDATVPVRASILHQRQFHRPNDREQLDTRSKKEALPNNISIPEKVLCLSYNLAAEDTFAPVTNVRFGSGTYLHSTSGESPFRPDYGKLLPHENSCLRISIIAVTAFIAVPFVKANRVLEIVLSIQVQPLVSSLDCMLLHSPQ